MPANTYTLIEKITVGAAGASEITFTSIPQTYTDLVIKSSIRSSLSANQDEILLKFNGSTTSYSYRQLYGGAAGGSIVTGSGAGGPSPIFSGVIPATNNTASTFGSNEMYIPNYAGSNYKSVSIDSVSENNASTYFQLNFFASLWSNTSAITSVTLYSTYGANFAQYSTFYLYGIAKEGVTPSPSSAPYATGGDKILFDGTYWYHVFTSTGTFTPQKGLTADCLVIAGGGAGSGPWGAGGGAGGLQYTSSVSFTSGTNYTTTVGGGASYASQSTVQGTNSNITGTGLSLTAAVGGGGAGSRSGSQQTGGNGGSGGGAVGAYGSSTNTGGTGTSGQGNKGGNSGTSTYGMGGGGGAGAAAANVTNNNSTAGGAGSNTYSSWATATSTGVSGYYAGGGGGGAGGGGSEAAGGAGGGGGGGASINSSSPAPAGGNGTANTGSGGGGGGSNAGSGADGAGGNGGSGIIIVRYAA